MFENLFWVSSAILVYTYFGYGLLLLILSIFIYRPTKKSDYTPSISIIIAAYNEQDSIIKKLDNTLSLDYPYDDIEIIVGSDSSSDLTDSIVERYSDKGVRLIRVEGRQGKTAVQNECIKLASGQIIVFTDATTTLHKDSVRRLVSNFSDDNVGCVGARLIYKNIDQTQVGQGGTSYWNYETLIKKLESRVNSLIGVSGCFYAVRKNIYDNIPHHLISDFVIALQAVKKGYRVVFEENAICEEETLNKIPDEIDMRKRVALRTYTALFEYKELLNPLKYGFFSIQLWSHKVLRYFAGLFLIITFISNIFLIADSLYQITFGLQILFYCLAILGDIQYKRSNTRGILSIPYYFVLVNYAAIVALFKFIRGETIVIWETNR